MGRSFFKKPIEERRNERCPRCGIRKALCFCESIPNLNLATRVLLVMHAAERNLTTNTARLAHATLANSEIHVRGLRDQPVRPVDAAAPPGALVLFPSDDAEELNAEWVAKLERPVTLIVPDGTWRQAKKIVSREPLMQGVRRVRLPPGPASEYRLRVEPDEKSVCTFEAIARALGVLEGPQVQQSMEQLFRIMVARTLWARGLLRAEDCPGGIPEAALHQGEQVGS